VGSWTDRAGHLRAELQRLAGLVKRFRLPDEGIAGAGAESASARIAREPARPERALPRPKAPTLTDQ